MSLDTLIPLPINWLSAVLILIVAARPDGLPSSIRKVLTSWLGIIGLFAGGLVLFVTSRKKWLVEQILDERPLAISDRMVVTQAPNS